MQCILNNNHNCRILNIEFNILATPLPSSWLCLIIRIPTHPTTTPVALPLPPEPAAVGLVVVVVGQGGKPGPPGGDPGRWLDEAAVGGGRLEGEEQDQQDQQPHPEQV